MYPKRINIEILVGLPASGKTTYARSEENCGVAVVYCDSIPSFAKNVEKNLAFYVQKALNTPHISKPKIIIDGLFLTKNDVITAISGIKKAFNKKKSCEINMIIIRQWNSDRETCLKNDVGRRDINSKITIQNAPYESIIGAEIAAITGLRVDVIMDEVKLKPDWYRYLSQVISIDDTNKLYSETWTIDKETNSYSGEKIIYEPEQPVDFIELDELLETIAPNITYLQYRKLNRKCVSIEQRHISDYYGGNEISCRWVCDLPVMYELLSNFGILTEPEEQL